MRAAVLAVLVACGSSEDPPPGEIDAPVGGSTIMEVTPCVGEAATVTADPSDQATMYMPPATTITMGQIVKFELPAAHNVAPHPTMPSDENLRVNFGQTKCLRFTAAGSFAFQCTSHSFRGTVTVN
jgi:plastocyanin